MIKIPVDEAYALDYLSILQVKSERLGLKNLTVNRDHWRVLGSIIEQLDSDRSREIFSSSEYNLLYKTNQLLFDTIGTLREKGGVTAEEIDKLNLKRFECKQELQRKFFPEKPLAETKIGQYSK
jgi:hypothetical protein